MKIKVYRLLAQPEMPPIRWVGSNTWENPTQVTIISTSITDIHYVDKEFAVIVSNSRRYKISREDFDKIFEVEVL